MRRVLQLVFLVGALALVAGCIPSPGAGTGAGGGVVSALSKSKSGSGGQNPLQGLELDLTFMDVTASMLRTNHILLNMPVSSNAGWPNELDLENKDSKSYDQYLEEELSRHFSFFEYYGDMSWADFTSLNKAKERPIIEAAQHISKKLIHQREVIAKEEYKKAKEEKCVEFKRPLEMVILDNFTKGQGKSWISSEIDVVCLRDVQAAGKLHADFEEAFVSLLDPKYVGKYKRARDEYELQNEKLAELELKKAELKKKKKELKNETEDTSSEAYKQKKQDLDNQLEAVKTKIKNQEKRKENALNAYESLLEEAQKNVVVSPDRIELAKNMYNIVEAVEGNLSKATSAIPVVMAKSVYDVMTLAKHSGQLKQVLPVFVNEAMTKGGVKNKAEATKIAKKRLELITTRAATFLPDLISVAFTAYAQHDLYSPKMDYLEKLVEEGGGFEEDDGWF